MSRLNRSNSNSGPEWDGTVNSWGTTTTYLSLSPLLHVLVTDIREYLRRGFLKKKWKASSSKRMTWILFDHTNLWKNEVSDYNFSVGYLHLHSYIFKIHHVPVIKSKRFFMLCDFEFFFVFVFGFAFWKIWNQIWASVFL